MDPPVIPSSTSDENQSSQLSGAGRSQSFSSQKSDDSHTAAEFIHRQLQLEADAREALPFKFENCTKNIGKLRQVLFSCLTCNPPSTNLTENYNAAGVCYSCSIQCHGEHILVELFNKRDFVCDCGTTRLPATSPCTIRINPETNTKGGVHSEEPSPDNKYNKNFRNRFCGCDCDYDAYKEKGTMFQCLGLGTAETGGCGEDWWHPACVVGLAPDWYENLNIEESKKSKNGGDPPCITEVGESAATGSTGDATVKGTEVAPAEEVDEEDPPLPPGFPVEDDFEGFICYKCVDANPWIKRYAGTEGFLTPLFRRSTQEPTSHIVNAKKRKSEDDEESNASGPAKRSKDEMSDRNTESVLPETISGNLYTKVGTAITADSSLPCKVAALPPASSEQMSLFFKADFRTHLCRCGDCFPLLTPHPQLLEEETNYEPSISDSEEAGGSTQGSGSIYDRGESALKNVDRVRAIEGVMAYNHLKEKLKPFFQQFADSGKAISAEDIKAYFAKMRGDEQDIKQAGEDAKKSDEDNRREQGGH